MKNEIRDQLRKPLPAEAISQHPTKKFLSTIKAIYVIERLNDVFGIGGWSTKSEVVERIEKWVVCKTIMTIPEHNITLEAYGGNDNPDIGDAYKGAVTDGVTKIGSYLEIGIDVFKGKAPNKDVIALLDEWEAAVNACTDSSQLMYLYNSNKATVEADPLIRKLFSNHKNKVK